jgi:hypothetical protein
MKKLRILAVSFDTHIQPYQLSAFRGAVASKVGWEHDWFHNHDNSTEGGGKTINRYPLIQYKLDTRGDQMRPMLLCLDEAIEEAHHFFSQPEWSVTIKDQQHNLAIAQLRVNQYTLNVWQRPFSYRLHKWLALNSENYKLWQNLEGLGERVEFLEQKLRNHILSFAKGVDWTIEEKIEVKILSFQEPEWIAYKNIKTLAFTLDFKANISLPDFIGLGKGASRGLGVVKNTPKK